MIFLLLLLMFLFSASPAGGEGRLEGVSLLRGFLGFWIMRDVRPCTAGPATHSPRPGPAGRRRRRARHDTVPSARRWSPVIGGRGKRNGKCRAGMHCLPLPLYIFCEAGPGSCFVRSGRRCSTLGLERPALNRGGSQARASIRYTVVNNKDPKTITKAGPARVMGCRRRHSSGSSAAPRFAPDVGMACGLSNSNTSNGRQQRAQTNNPTANSKSEDRRMVCGKARRRMDVRGGRCIKRRQV